MAPKEGGDAPNRGAKVTAPAKLPVIAPFDSPEAIVQALSTREAPLLTAGLVQIERRALALVAKPAPRASPDHLLDYLTKYPTTDGVFAAWDLAHKTNNSQLSAAVLSALSALIRLVSTDPFDSDPQIIRRLLSNYGSHLDRALNPGRNDVTMAALKLCNVVVGFGSGRFARKLFGCMAWQPKIISRLYSTRLTTKDGRDVLQKPDIRTLLTMLVLAFLSASDSRLKTEVLEQKTLLAGILKGLSKDPESVVNHVLVALQRDVVADRSIGLEARRNVLDEPCILELVKLYDTPVAEDETSPQHLRISVHRFLYAVTDWLAVQINDSPARSFGPQKVLGIILRSLKVTEDPEQRELGLYILGQAPILAGPFWARFPSSLDPRLSSRWISAITFATQAVSLPAYTHLSLNVTTLSSPPPSIQQVLDTILPPSINKIWFSKALNHENGLVSFLASLFLLAVLQKAAVVLEAIAGSSKMLEEDGIAGRWSVLGARVRDQLRTILPDPQIIVALMQKTAVGASAATTMPKKKKSKTTTEEEMAVEKKEGDDSSGRHLRTNIALRLLWLYHRVVPAVIATLRFDFAKLPMAHVAPTTDAEGLRAISSSYALRLAAVHNSTVTYSRPSDHFKNTLVPLFNLYRTPSTPSNRSLLLSTLARLLDSPSLFGQTSENEVDVWLSSLPSPTEGSPTNVLDFFEACVQKTLTAPLRPAEMDQLEKEATLSPLLSTFIADLEAQLASREGAEKKQLLAFVQRLMLAFVGSSASIVKPKKAIGAVVTVLGDEETTITLLQDCVRVLEEKVDRAAEDEDMVMEESSALSPVTENVFVSSGNNHKFLAARLATMPTELVLLHAQPSDFSSLAVSTIISDLVVSRSHFASALQTLLHRFIGVSWEDNERKALAGFILALLGSVADARLREQLGELLFGEHALLAVFGQKKSPFVSITSLIGQALNTSTPSDVVLAQPYCAVILEEARTLAGKKAGKAKKISARLLSSTPLLPYFSPDSAVEFFSALLVGINSESVLREQAASVLDAAFHQASLSAGSSAFQAMWCTHFLVIHQLSCTLDSAGTVLVAGAQALLPFSVGGGSSSITSVDDSTWRSHISSWSAATLSRDVLRPTEATVLAALLYRSAESRSQFTSWLAKRASKEGTEQVDGVEAPLAALLEISAARGESVKVPEAIARLFAERVLAPDEVSEDLSRAVVLMCVNSAAAAGVVKATFETEIPKLDRDVFLPRFAELLGALSQKTDDFGSVLDAFVNGSFAGLVRRFAEDEEDTPIVEAFVGSLLSAVVQRGQQAAYKAHLLDPLITAAVTRRLHKTGPILLAAALCQSHTLTSSEVTRHLNNVFANPNFRPRTSTSDPDDRKAQSAMVKLVSALATASFPAAAASRLVEKLMPFYGGTMSADDISLLALFHRVEIISSGSVSVAFRQWNPSLDQSPLESTRAGALRSLQVDYVHRSWLRVCASSTTTFPKEHEAITYDPMFLLPYLHQTLAEDELKGADWAGIVETGVLGLPVAALASSSNSVRLLARATLATALKKVDSAAFREKDEVLLVLAHARNCLYSQAGEAIPSVIALFLANAMAAIGTPSSALYPAFNRFLLQRALLDQRDVPMFYLLFYSSGDEPDEDHRWLIKFLSEGLVRTQDWRIYRRRQTFELLASLLFSTHHNLPLRKLILQFLIRATSIPLAAQQLLARNGLLGWLAVQTPVDATERRLIAAVLAKVVDVLSGDRIGNVTDALDALCVLYAKSEISASEVSALCSPISKLLRLLLSSRSPPAAIRLVLDRVARLLSTMLHKLPSDKEVQKQGYALAMLFGFVWQSVGGTEGKREKEIFSAGLRAGLAAGVAGLRQEIVKSMSH